MKRFYINQKKFCSMLCMLMIVALSIFPLTPIYAASFSETNHPENPRLIDEADLLTDAQEVELNARIEKAIEQYRHDIVIILLQNYKEYTNSNIYDFAKETFIDMGYGVGEKGNGIILMMSMDDRDYAVVIRNDTNSIIDEYRYKEIEKQLLRYLKMDAYYDGLNTFVTDVVNSLEMGKAPVRYFSHPLRLLISAVVAGVVVFLTIKSMSNKRQKTEAGDYLVRGSFKLLSHDDVFSHRTVTKRARPKSDISGGSGGSGGGGGGISGGGSGKF